MEFSIFKYIGIAVFILGSTFFLSFMVFASRVDISKIVKRSIADAISKYGLYVLIGIYILIFSTLAILKFHAYNMGIIDFGRMDQVIWNTSQGRFFINTFEFGNVSRLFAHCEFIYLLIAPLYRIFSDPRMLLILQSVVISLGAIPIYWLAKENLKSNFVALCFGIGYFLFPSLQYGNLADFHPDMLATTFLLFTLYYLEKKKWNRFFIFLFLSLMCKEYVSLIVIMLGGYIIFNHKNIKIGSLCLSLGIGWFILTFFYIPSKIPIDWYWNDTFDALGSSINEVMKNVLLHPIAVIRNYFNINKLANFGLVLLPLGFLSLLNLKILILCFPVVIGIALSPYYTYASHHYGTIIPFIFVSAIGAASYLADKVKRKNTVYAIGIFVLCNSLFSSSLYGFSPLSLRFWNKSSFLYWGNSNQFKKTSHDYIADKFIKMIPDEIPISVSNHLGAHLSQRETIYYFPYPEDLNNIEYVLIDLLEYIPASFYNPRKREISELNRLINDERFGIKSAEDGILLFKKDLPKRERYRTNIQIIKDCHPRYRVNDSLGNRLKLIGYDFRPQKSFGSGSREHIIYYWRVLEDFDKPFLYSSFGLREELNKSYIIVDTLSNGEFEFRIVHLPTYILYPSDNWEKGDIIKEEFDFYVSETIPEGNYIWQTGLYIVPTYFTILTEQKHLVPGTEKINLGVAKLVKQVN